MDRILSEIERIAKENNGFVKTCEVELAGISRPMLRKYIDSGNLEQVRKAIFSYGTALYLWGLSDRTPHIFDITVPRGTNISRLKRDNQNIRCHYVQLDVYELGIAEIQSPQGGMVRLYDKERCICDLIRDKEKMDIQIYTQAIKDYFKTKVDHRKLLKYSKIFGVEEKVRTYMEVL